MPTIRSQDAPTLEEKVAFLRRPSSYPGPTRSVQAIQTHMSWVFLTDTRAYKMKKPVRLGVLDYVTLEARRLNCLREVSLNRRAAPRVYLGTVGLCRRDDGRLRLGESGRVVEWLVEMQRLPEHLTLHHAIVHKHVDRGDIRRAIDRLAAFFGAVDKAPVAPDEYRRRLRQSVAGVREFLGRPEFALPGACVAPVAAGLLDFIDGRPDLLGARGARIVEGHGDLRPEHVYLFDDPLITDCLEFDRELRLLDPLDEVAFLAMECERLGAQQVGDWLIDDFGQTLGECWNRSLVDFYRARNALARAKLAAWHLDDGAVTDHDKWQRRTREYLGIARRYAGTLSTGDCIA